MAETTVSTSNTTASDSSVTPAAKRKLRPARRQVAPGEIDKSEKIQVGKEYNVWYNKWAGGDREDPLASQTLSQSRCIISRDAGYTRADATGNKYCCLYFARGCCSYGHECTYLHRLPLPGHQLPDNSRDCFAREKHAEYRDDMGGVGSFNRVNRTLYVSKIQESPDKKQTEETLLRHFSEWGKIVKTNILYNRGVAFITYESPHNASFAKEAMANQSLDMDEILNVRWATEDPNPTEKIAEEKRVTEMGREAISGMLDENLIEAAQTLRALEEGDEKDYYHIEASRSGGGDDDVNDDEAERGGEEEVEERPTKRVKQSNRNGTSKGGGLFDSEALDNLKFYAELARKQAEEERERRLKTKSKVPAVSAVSLLGGYGSGDESD